MSSTPADSPGDPGRRHFLLVASSAMGAIGVVATAVPFLASWRPSAKAKALGAPVEVDISKLEPGALIKVEWRGKAVYVLHRSPQMLETLKGLDSQLADPNSENAEQQPEYIKGATRSLKPEILVTEGVCTHLGCAPIEKFKPGDAELGADWLGGFFCPCHGSKFDLSGRVYAGVPAQDNLKVPPHRFVNDNLIMIGSDPEVA